MAMPFLIKLIYHEANRTIPKSYHMYFVLPPTLFYLKTFNHDALNSINIGNLYILLLMHNKRLVCMPVGGQKNDYLAAFSGDDV